MSSLGLIWLGRLAHSGVLDFLLFLSKFYRKTAITSSKSEVEHDFSKTHVPGVNLKLVCQRSNFTRGILRAKNREVEHDFSRAHVPGVNFKLLCKPSNFTRFLNP